MIEPVLVVDDAHPQISVMTLNRPEKRNALSSDLLLELCEAVAQTESRHTRRVLILRAAGPAFCAGLDLAEAMDLEAAERAAHLVARALRTLIRTRLVTIAAVQGPALAGGAGIMSACDLVVAAEGVQIGYPEVHRGLVAGMVLGLLTRQVGQRQARELVLLGQPITAERAAAIGLVNRVVPAARLLPTAMEWASQALCGGPMAVERTKVLLSELQPGDIDADLTRALRHHMAARESAEAEEGLRAFVEKRPPRWQPASNVETRP